MKLHFGARIKQARIARGYTQKDLAEKLGIEGNSLARVERGENGLGWTAMELLLGALGEPMTYYFSNQTPQFHRQEVTPQEALEVLQKAISSPSQSPSIPEDRRELVEKILNADPEELGLIAAKIGVSAKFDKKKNSKASL